MSKRTWPNIRICFLLSVFLTALCCCGKEDPFRVEFFSASGLISDKNDGTPVSEINVVLSAYSVDDLSRTQPLFSKSCLSSSDGTYQVSMKSETDLSNAYFVFTLKDVSETRAVKYEPFERILYLQPTSQFYSSFMKSYEVKDNDFDLVPVK